MTRLPRYRLGPPLLALSFLFSSTPSHAFRFSSDNLEGAFDTTVSYGAQWRVEPRDADLVGRANGGRAFSVNGDDGNLNYDTGLVSHLAKVTHDLALSHRNLTGFFRATYFYDFESKTKNALTPDQRDRAGRDFELLDAYVQGTFEPFGRPLAVRVGEQVLSWGESTFIQNGINVINPVDVTRLRAPGSELREAFLPSSMIWSSVEVARRVNVEGFYLTEWDRIELDVCGTYFSTSDVGCEEGDRVLYSGFGLAPEGTPAATIQRLGDRDADDHGQFGAALHSLLPVMNDVEVGLYYMNYHSRVPFVSAISRNPGSSPFVFFEYPEDIQLVGGSFNTELGRSGLAFQAEYSHRLNQPLAIDGIEIIAAGSYLPLAQVPRATAPNQTIRGFRRHDVSQWQGTLTKSFGPRNPFAADQWTILLEGGATRVFGLPRPGVLRYDAPNTDLPGAAGFPGAPGVQRNGWATAFSWGYVLSTNVTFNQVIGPVNLTPGLSFSHDVNGTTPSPLNNFVENRKALTATLRGDYLNSISAEVGYTMFYGAGNANLLHDRDFVSANVKYSF